MLRSNFTPRPHTLIVLAALLAAFALMPAQAPGQAARKQVAVGPGVTLEISGAKRRVVVVSSVILRKGVLEGLLTRAKKKEHEFILAAEVDARHIHTALEAASAKAGHPVVFAPQFKPPTGTVIRVSLRYAQNGKTHTVAASDWVRDLKAKKPLAGNWVFAGSRFGPHPEGDDKPRYYMANHGDLISLCNIETALLDLSQRSPKALNDRMFEAATEKIPPVGTRVEVILEPVASK